MALTQQLNSISGKSAAMRQIFTFFVEDMMFGLDVSHVLMLGQNVNEVQRLPVEAKGLSGVIKYQGHVVPVLDFAHRLGISSGTDVKNTLLAELMAREQDHVEWLNALERSIKTDEAFTKAVNPNECTFGRWYNQFETRDDTLRDLLRLFDEPHRKIHSLAEELLRLSSQDQKQKALEILNHQRITTLSKLRGLFARAREQVKSAMRPILLYVTRDGLTPRYALLIDEVNDVLNYSDADLHTSNQGPLSQFRSIEKVLNGIYTRDDRPDCLYFNVDLLTDDELAQVSSLAQH